MQHLSRKDGPESFQTAGNHNPSGWWKEGLTKPFTDESTIKEAVYHIRQPFFIIKKDNRYGAGLGGKAFLGEDTQLAGAYPVSAYVHPCPIENLGDPTFCSDLGIQYPYLSGSMANGISSSAMVEDMGCNGMLGFFGASGLDITQVESAINRISSQLNGFPFGFNLIHSPNDPILEAAIVDLYIRRGVKLVEASAYMDMTLPLVRYRVHGISRDRSEKIITPNRIIAKLSRVEVASKFFAPPPERFLRELVASGEITEEQAHLAAQIPMAQDVTAEANSGGHTDNRPAVTLLPTIIALRDRMQEKYGFSQRLRVGLAGGIATPSSATAGFSMGAAYVMVGSINQACIESGTTDEVRQMLAQTEQADITMAPAADMFEMGVTVQVLKRGTMFAMRGAKLYEVYNAYNGIEEIPASVRTMLEKNIFRDSLENIWALTREYFLKRDKTQVERAEIDPKHLMALVFRWYLGQSSRWANSGEISRKIDFQIWCGPSMGAFNEWTKGSFLESPGNRKVVDVALNLLFGTAVTMRMNNLRCQGIQLSPEFTRVVPLEQARIREYLN